MEYDNDRDRFAHGFDAGTIVDGEVRKDPDSGELVIVDDEGKAFSSQALFRLLEGKRIRFSCVAFEAMENIEKMMVKANAQQDGN